MKITVYDGADTIGGNKILLEDQGINIFFDFGINFNLRNKYFEEYLVPRPRRGLLDMLHMGLLPPLKRIYRPDLEIEGVDIWSRVRVPYPIREIEIHGVLLSHAHLDHSGYISFLRGHLLGVFCFLLWGQPLNRDKVPMERGSRLEPSAITSRISCIISKPR